MSKRKRERNRTSQVLTESGFTSASADSTTLAEPDVEATRFQTVFTYTKKHLWLVAAIGLFSIVAFGAGIRIITRPAIGPQAKTTNEGSLLSRLNPFAPAPPPPPTTSLSKEYIYAGSRLLAVEDANANAAPPADLAVWRKSTGVWYVLGGPGSTYTEFGWGNSTDIPAQGDFDGDGKTDFSVFRPSEGNWYVFYSSTSTYAVINYGTNGDKPVMADFDGDGKTDLVLYRPSTSVWYFKYSSTGAYYSLQYGLSSDVPAAADYDGDGRADIGVWRPSTHTFYSTNSSNGQIVQTSFGSTGDTPVCADYDGDGKANYAVRSGASWIIMNTALTATTTTTPPGDIPSDIPVPNDYDGDGKVDIATWRDSNGFWSIRQSSNGQPRYVQFGSSGDIPVPAYYRR